ncbi:MAG TPA: DUF1295 domain-containing protein [Nannocystis exedens]|nr:DUF1295 domain-containing protein [Nannocystis exedens]
MLGLFASAVLTFLALTFISAPYGRHRRQGWGPTMNTRAAWVLMESPAVFGFIAVFFAGEHAWSLVPLILLAIWQAHYVQRTLVYPFLLRTGGKPTPISVVAMGFTFNAINAYLNARMISHFALYEDSWLLDPRFLVGAALFAFGYSLNRSSDRHLRNLRAPGESDYKIPRGGAFELVSCPNYLGELIEWVGWAVATWSLAGVSFAVFTAANLVPRALSHHRWYREQFPDYPRTRRAMLPFVL